MSRVIRSRNPAAILRTKTAIKNHLLAKVEAGTAGLIGLEQEMFVTDPAGGPPPFDAIEAVMRHMAEQLPGAETLTENGRVVAVAVEGLGDICLEPGGQIELSSAPSQDLTQLEKRQETLLKSLTGAATALGLRVKGAGHLPSFKAADLVPRSRFAAYVAYCRAEHGDEKAEALVATMKSCTGLQVNVDPMGPDFHEIYRALMLVELAGCFRDLSVRQQRFAETYAPLFPRQVTPLFNAVAARSNGGLMDMIVDRLLTLHMPFVPDPGSAEGFLPSAAVYGATPTVGELMRKGVLTVELLDNALSLQMTMPNLRRHGVVETRAPDTPATLPAVMAIAERYHRAAYDVAARKALLALPVDAAALEHAYAARFTISPDDLAMLPIGGGKTVADFIRSVDRLTCPENRQKVQKNKTLQK